MTSWARDWWSRGSSLLLLAMTLGCACVTSPKGTPVSVPPVTSATVAKVKNLLVGLPPTDAEVKAVVANPAALEKLVGEWMTLPQYDQLMLSFFITQFQQDQWAFLDLTPEYGYKFVPFDPNTPGLVLNLQESFARTVMELIAEGQPFTSAMTTTRFMMTPAEMVAYASMDVLQTNDEFNVVDLFQITTPTSVTLESTTPIPIEQAIDPTSPNYMTFYDPGLATSYQAGCPYGTIVYPAPASAAVLASFLFDLWPLPPPSQPNCNPPFVPASAAYFADSDFTSWQMINIRQPKPGEATPGSTICPRYVRETISS